MQPATPTRDGDGSGAATAPPPKFVLWREELRRAWSELRGPGTTPARAATSMAVGLFVGSLPIFGTHTPILVFLCLWFQLDAAIAWIASNVSNPFFAPFLLGGEVQVGAWLRTGAPLALDPASMRAVPVRHFLGYLALGAPLVAAVLAAAGGLVTYAVVAAGLRSRVARPPYQLPAHAPPWFCAVEDVASRYASPSSQVARERTRFHYLRAKLLTDPAARIIVDVARDRPGGFGAVLDVGTGRGQLPLLLLQLGHATSARGMDWDKGKIADAQHAARGEAARATFLAADVREASFEPADTVLLVDILHYFALDEQDRILDRAALAVRPGGLILVREADAARGWRSWATLLEERVFTFLRFNVGERVRFRPAADIAARLEARGLRCEVRPAWAGTPFSNVLVVARRA